MRRVCAVPDVSDLRSQEMRNVTCVSFFSRKCRRTLKHMLCSLLEWGERYCAHVSNHVADGIGRLAPHGIRNGAADAEGGESEREIHARSLAFRN